MFARIEQALSVRVIGASVEKGERDGSERGLDLGNQGAHARKIRNVAGVSDDAPRTSGRRQRHRRKFLRAPRCGCDDISAPGQFQGDRPADA